MTRWVNLGDLTARDADPDALALIDLRDDTTPRQYRHGDIVGAANAVARALVARGAQRGDRIAILAANRVEYLTAYLGTMRAGMIAVPVNFKLPRETIDYVMRDAGVSLVFADAERRRVCPDGLSVVELRRL